MPVPTDGADELLCWWLPVRRGVFLLDSFRPTRSLLRARRRYTIRIDTAFEAVIDGCGDPSRPHGWITPAIRAAYVELHRLGHAHSVEAWEDGDLCGGLYGVAIGGLFAAESKFHRRTDASKAAVLGLIEMLQAQPDGQLRLIDTQWSTPHLASLGVVEVDRSEYRRRLDVAVTLPEPLWQSDGGGRPASQRAAPGPA